jgi:hypothetical protein
MLGHTRCSAVAILLGLWFAMRTDGAGAALWLCRARPVEPCFKHHGRLSSQNGIALKIWLLGTTRMVALDNDLDDLPAIVRKYLEMASRDHSYIYGDFDICPLEPDTPGHLRRVCVVAAEKLVVQNLQGSMAPFRLLSTWPATQASESKGTLKKQ